MRRIQKLKAVAGSALFLGATVVGGAAMVSAQDGSSGDLGDYPAPFVDADGAVDANIVVGDNAKTADVVGAIDIAGALSQHAYSTETQVAGGAAGSWTASNGVTLSTVNQNLFLGNAISEVRSTLTQNDLTALETTEFVDAAGENTDIDYYFRVGDGDVIFEQSDYMEDEEEDPALHIPVAESLYTLEAVFGSGVDFTDGDVAGEDIELFGQTYTVASDMETEDTLNEITLWGSAQTLTLETGETGTFTLDGNEHTIEVRYISDDNSVTLRVNGEPEHVAEEETFRVDGQDVRVSGLFPEGDGEGLAQFQIGSDEIILENGEAIEADDETVDGTVVYFNGNHDPLDDGDVDVSSISSIAVQVGAEDEDGADDAIRAGESFSHSFFENIEVHFGGLNPDAADGAAEADFSTDGEIAEVTVTDRNDNTATVEFAHWDGAVAAGPEDGDIATDDDTGFADETDGDTSADGLDEGHLFITDAGGFTDMYEVDTVEDDEVVLENVFTGDEVEIEDEDLGDDDKVVDEIINGQTYYFNVTDTGDLDVAWTAYDQRVGSSAALELENGAYLEFTDTDGTVTIHEPEDAGNNRASYDLTAEENSEGDGLEISDVSAFTLQDLESDDDLKVGYTNFGTYVEYDDSDEGEVTLNLPAVQASAGVAVTDVGGAVSADGAGTVQTSVPAGWPDSGLLDSDVGSAERAQNMILVGGPAVNTLVEELADDGQTMTAGEYTEGEAIVQHVGGAFNNNDALIVAGHSAQDTTNAASALANMNTDAGTLLGDDVAGVGQVTIDTASNSVSATE